MILVSNDGKSKDMFTLDYIFEPDTLNSEVFGMVLPLLKSAINGCNVCVIAYGASGNVNLIHTNWLTLQLFWCSSR